MHEFRCIQCHKLLGKYRECKVLEIKCPRCGNINTLNRPQGKEITTISTAPAKYVGAELERLL